MFAILATLPQYAAHLAPLAPWAADDADVVVVASASDQRIARILGKRAVVMEHGVGQSYGNRHPAYPGGMGRGDALAFLTPNEYSARLWRAAYPHVPVEAVGSPRLDTLPGRVAGDGPVVAVSFHWPCMAAPPWSGSAFREYRAALGPLSERYRVLGHGHPRSIDSLEPVYRALGIEVVRDFGEVCRRADVYVADNSSTLYEFASTGRPVVVLNSTRWPHDRGPGLRFWEASGVGVNVDRPADLVAAVEQALEDPGDVRLAREHALSVVYSYRSGAAQRAAEAIESLGVPA